MIRTVDLYALHKDRMIYRRYAFQIMKTGTCLFNTFPSPQGFSFQFCCRLIIKCRKSYSVQCFSCWNSTSGRRRFRHGILNSKCPEKFSNRLCQSFYCRNINALSFSVTHTAIRIHQSFQQRPSLFFRRPQVLRSDHFFSERWHKHSLEL